jgi:hypothetical protein
VVAISIVVAIAFALESVGAHQSPGGQAVVPADVSANLRADYGITIATPPRSASSRLTLKQVRALAVEEYGDLPVSAHLVLYSDPEFGDAPSELAAGEDDAVITPVYMNHLAWLVVVRGATPALHGPPGGTYDATIAVFIDAKTGGELTSVTLPLG